MMVEKAASVTTPRYVRVVVMAETPETLDAASGILWDFRPLGIEEHDGTSLTAFFPPGTETANLVEDLRAAALDGVRVEVGELAEEDWLRPFREAFHRFEPLPGVAIRPPWEARSGSGIDIVIEPGAAFGTGLHESTRAMLALLARALDDARRLPRVLDVGSGSGLLAFYAARRGARVVALEIDRLAVENLLRNRAHNGLVCEVALVCGGPVSLRARFDVVLANLTAEAIEGMREALLARAAEGGVICLAGLLSARRDEALAIARSMGRVTCMRLDGEWLALEVRTAGHGS